MNTTPSGRVQVRSRGELQHPGACALCGSGTFEGDYVDVGIYYDYEGQVYFCLTCATEIAETIGCLTPDESDYLKSQNENVANELSTLKVENDELKSRLAHYDSLMHDAFAEFSANYNTEPSADEEQPAESGPVNEPFTTEGSGESVARKPVKSRRSNDVKQPSVRNEGFSI